MNIHVQTLKRKEEEKKKTAGKESCLKLSVPESRFTIKNSNVFSLNIHSLIHPDKWREEEKRREEKKKKSVGRHNFCPDCSNRSNGSPVEAPSNARRPREVT